MSRLAVARTPGKRLAPRFSYSRAIDHLVASDVSLLELVEAVRGLAYGRPSDGTIAGMLRERRGTCSTKHLFLAERLRQLFPETEPQIVHRVYRVNRDRGGELFGEDAVTLIPADGLLDVHRYITINLDGRQAVIDVTFPGPAWDGHSSLPLACGPGRDYPAGPDPDIEKKQLEAENCDPAVREPFIAALALPHGRAPAADDA